MGHERVGILPRTSRWRFIVNKIAQMPTESSIDVAQIADETLKNVRSRFDRIHKDKGVKAAFAYLISLATSHLPSADGLTSVDTLLSENPSPTRIAKYLSDWVKKNADSREYAEVACRAAADTISEWTRSQSKQKLLFDDKTTAQNVWSESSSGKGFCQVARLFFANFTERYLKYFLEREASAVLPTLKAREQFSQNLHSHIEEVSHHAFETSKITQSFAAGWFNNRARESRPSDIEIENFLALAFRKVQEELKREASR